MSDEIKRINDKIKQLEIESILVIKQNCMDIKKRYEVTNY